MDIDDFLNGSAPADATDDVQPEEAPASQPRDEHGRFAPKGDQPEPPAPAEPEPTAPPAVQEESRVPTAALQEERRKRQELEQRLAQYEAYVQQQQQQAPPIPSVYEDENGFADGLTQLAVLQAEQRLMPRFQQELGAMKRDLQEAMARARYPDWEEKARHFVERARENPALVEEMRRQPDPAEYAYRWGKNALEVQQIGSLDLEAIKAAAVKEYLAAQPQPAPTIPQTLADAQSSRSSTVPYAPPSLDEIIGRR